MRTRNKAFTLIELMVVVAIIGLLASILATNVIGKMLQAGKELDKKTVQDLFNELQVVTIRKDRRTHRNLAMGPLSEARGRQFWEGCLRYGILDREMSTRLVANAGNDFAVDRRDLDNPDTFQLLPENCSWTGPQGNEVFGLLMARGPARRVVICANERNWFTHRDEVLTMWSDGEVAEYVNLQDLQDWSYQITPEQWETPAASLFGKVRPFDGVFE